MPTVLVVDDEFTIADSIAELLHWEGYDVRVAPNGARGLEELQKGDVDLVLLDYMMPVMDGMQLLAKIRGSDALRSLKVVLVTAVPERLLPRKDFDAFLPKPFEVDDLIATVKRFLTPGPKR